jgi:hypothetical protein
MVPKWNLLKTVPRGNSIPTSNSSEAVINLGEDNDDENVIVNLERPIGVTSHIAWVWRWRCAYMYTSTLNDNNAF